MDCFLPSDLTSIKSRKGAIWLDWGKKSGFWSAETIFNREWLVRSPCTIIRSRSALIQQLSVRKKRKELLLILLFSLNKKLGFYIAAYVILAILALHFGFYKFVIQEKVTHNEFSLRSKFFENSVEMKKIGFTLPKHNLPCSCSSGLERRKRIKNHIGKIFKNRKKSAVTHKKFKMLGQLWTRK